MIYDAGIMDVVQFHSPNKSLLNTNQAISNLL